MWPFSMFCSKPKPKHKDEVQAFKYNNTLYVSLHAMNAAKERDARWSAIQAVKQLLYGLAVNNRELDRLEDFERHGAEIQIERRYVFRGEERDLQKLSELLIDHWPYVQSHMYDYHNAKKKREES